MIWGIKAGTHSEWTTWYAWYPVRAVCGRWAWLQWIERIDAQSKLVSSEDYRTTSGISNAFRIPQ